MRQRMVFLTDLYGSLFPPHPADPVVWPRPEAARLLAREVVPMQAA